MHLKVSWLALPPLLFLCFLLSTNLPASYREPDLISSFLHCDIVMSSSLLPYTMNHTHTLCDCASVLLCYGTGKKLIERHRMVNTVLQDELKATVHALSIQASQITTLTIHTNHSHPLCQIHALSVQARHPS